jgi:plastocyanin
VRAAARTDAAVELRTVVLVARGMTFYLEGESEPNPRLVVDRGEVVRFVLRNDDPGMGHDLTLPTLGRRSELLREAGTRTELALRAPEAPGEHPYLCSLHARSMVGVLEVR